MPADDRDVENRRFLAGKLSKILIVCLPSPHVNRATAPRAGATQSFAQVMIASADRPMTVVARLLERLDRLWLVAAAASISIPGLPVLETAAVAHAASLTSRSSRRGRRSADSHVSAFVVEDDGHGLLMQWRDDVVRVRRQEAE